MGNFLKNNIDWCLSRDRYWGTPLNVWMCEDEKCGNYTTVGSIDELVKLSGCDRGIELHKPYIDAVTFKCDKCGKTMRRESAVIDVWYDSGAMPFAQFHYPFENKEEFARRYPADFIFEGYDQTRGWFYSLEAINTALFNAPPMKNCLANGMICDEKGQKMSKRLGNYTDPMVFIKKYGGDAVRFMFYNNAQPYNDVIFAEDLLVDAQKKFLNVLYNNYSFYVLYANIDGFKGGQKTVGQVELSIMDRYILSKLNRLIRSVKEKLSAYMATEASRELADFCDDLSNWYIRRCRKRFWGESMSADKEAAFTTLYTALSSFTKICAPFVPFIAEEIYLAIERPFVKDAPESVHLCQYPPVDERYIDDEIERLMDKTYGYCELGRNARNQAKTKTRQPLGRMYIKDGASDGTLPDEYKGIISDELNIKEIVESDDIDKYVSYTLKPQLKTLGPKYNKLIGKIRDYLAAADGAAIVKKLSAGEIFTVDIDGTAVELAKDDVLVSTKELDGYIGAANGGLSIVLDTNLTKQLIDEYYCREFVSKVQALRKSRGFDITERIKIEISGDGDVVDIVLGNQNRIKTEILVTDILRGAGGEIKEEFDVDGRVVAVAITRNRAAKA
jgi:isoleucyl-tRNA synthetase